MSSYNFASQKVLITGGLGFIGSNIAQKFVKLGAQVTIYDMLDPKSGGNIHNISGIEGSVQVLKQDIRNFESVCTAISGQDIIFHCAAYTSHPNSMKDPLMDIEVNCKGTINVLEAARRFNPDVKFIHIGTSTQIGKMHYQPIDELHPEFPVDIYSANKSVSEKYVSIYGHAYRMKTAVVRFANVFGPRSNIRSPDFGFMNYFIGLALQDKDLTVFGEGKQQRNVSYIDDCVDALVAVSQSERSWGQVFFAASDEQCTVAEIAEAITREIGGRVRYVDWPSDRQVIEIGDSVVTNQKIKSFVDWKPQWDLARGLKEAGLYFRPNLKRYLG